MNPIDDASVEQAASSAQIQVNVNGVLMTVPRTTLAQWVVDSTGATPVSLATAVNGLFVARAARAQQWLAEGDVIVTFQPIEGG
jgi:sulfur carrier protein